MGLPIDIRRANWGWFGIPWPSYVCYDDDGRLLTEMQKEFPTGERCMHCDEVFDEAAGDSGQAMPSLSYIRHVHKECMLRIVVGSLAHLEKRCTCCGGPGDSTSHLSPREEAVAVWNRYLGLS